MDRPARVPHAQGDTSLAKTSPESTLNEALQRSPRDEAATGDATLIGTQSGDVSHEMKSPIKASPDKPLSPVRKVANGDSPSGKSPASSEKADESMDSEDSLFGQEGEAKETHDKEEEAVAHPGSTNGRTQVEDVESPIMVDEKPLPSEGKGRPHGFAPMPSDGARQGSAASQHRDLGYLYSVSLAYSDNGP